MERYEIVKDIGSGSFGDAKLVRHKITRDFFAVKFIQRGSTINENVEREIINQRSLKHPNIIRFKEILLTPTHLAIVMEYASGGELFQRICDAGRAIEDEARFFFQQLISGVSYCHSMGICHRDLKLENMLLDGSVAPRVKICDFGCSKSSTFHSQPKSAVGTAAYIAPEVFSQKEYDGKIADVWSCGVSLYVMLVWDYPFGDPKDPESFSITMRRILSANYTIPDSIQISVECRQLLYKIFVANPKERITIPEIKQHPWYLKNLPVEWQEGGSSQSTDANDASQSIGEILSIVQEARALPEGLSTVGDIMDFLDDGDTEDIEASGEFTEDMEASGEFVCPM